MSILIKGMDMPKASNEDCIAVIRSNGKVEVWQTGMKEFEAQAIQIPDIQYEAFTEFQEILLKKIENHILYGEEGK